MTDRAETDWEAVEAEYRAGQRAIRQIARRHGLSDTAIRKRAKAGGWVRDTANLPVEAEQEHIPARAAVAFQPPAPRSAVSLDGGGDEALALGADLALRLLSELDLATSCQDEIEDAINDETRNDKDGQRRALMMKAVSLPARVMTLKTLAQVVAVLRDAGQGAEKGKKQQRQENAQKAASGRFAPPAPPKLVVNNGS
ncbi:terminase [Roseomonas sp. BN140053]|uniref:terminase n=1 Tax=Roseomonas sp. BN140053 TaxID=3391898 RepID=UPI0039EB90B4